VYSEDEVFENENSGKWKVEMGGGKFNQGLVFVVLGFARD